MEEDMKNIIIISLIDILCIMVYGVSVNIVDRSLKTVLRYLAFLLLILTGILLKRFNAPVVMILFAIVNAASVIAINYFEKREKAHGNRDKAQF